MIQHDMSFNAYVDRIASQNDAVRRTLCLGTPGDPALKGCLIVTDTVRAMGPAFLRCCLDRVGRFDDFPADADPDGYRTCGSVEVEDRTVWFKIILSDAAGTGRGTDATGQPVETIRTLHVLFASDWLSW